MLVTHNNLHSRIVDSHTGMITKNVLLFLFFCDYWPLLSLIIDLCCVHPPSIHPSTVHPCIPPLLPTDIQVSLSRAQRAGGFWEGENRDHQPVTGQRGGQHLHCLRRELHPAQRVLCSVELPVKQHQIQCGRKQHKCIWYVSLTACPMTA